jgi:hypothetical protein
MKGLLDKILNKVVEGPIKLTREQFDEAVTQIIEDKFTRDDETYNDDIQMLLQRGRMESCYDLEYFQGKDIYGKNYYFKVKTDGEI